MRVLLACAIAGLVGAVATGARADDYPSRAVQVYVGFPPGSGADILTRFYADRMATALKQAVVVQNKPGANGNIAAEGVARARPDGYTLLFGPSAAMAGGKYLYKNMPVDALKDLAMVAPLNELGFVLTVGPTSSFRTVQDLTSYLKANPNRSYGTANSMGIGSALLYLNSAGVSAQNVGYRTTADGERDLESGLLDFLWVDSVYGATRIKDGRLRGLAVTTTRRLPQLENVPTMQEAGFANYAITGWWMVLAPAGTPPDIVNRLNAVISDISRTDEAKAFFANLASVPLIETPAGATRKLVDDTKQWGLIAKLGNIQPQ